MRKVWILGAAIAASLALAGCGGSGNGLINVPNPRVRFVNAFPGVTNAKVKVGSDIIGGAAGIAFGSVSDYVITNNGNKDLTAGDSTFDNLAVLDDQLFETKKRYTGIGYGTSPRTILLLEENKDEASSSTVSLRVANAAQARGAVDVYVTDSTGSSTLPVAPSFPNVGVGTISAFASVPAPSGPLSARIRIYAVGQTATPLVDKVVVLDSRQRGAIVLFDDAGQASQTNAIVLKENL